MTVQVETIAVEPRRRQAGAGGRHAPTDRRSRDDGAVEGAGHAPTGRRSRADGAVEGAGHVSTSRRSGADGTAGGADPDDATPHPPCPGRGLSRWASAILRHFVAPPAAAPAPAMPETWLPPAPPPGASGDVRARDGERASSRRSSSPRGRRVAVLGAPADVAPVAAAVANEVRGRAGSVVCAWSPGSAPADVDALATRTARRLAAELGDAGAPATARGRVAWMQLPHDAAEAAAHVDRVASTHVPAGAVLAIAGPRPEEFDPLLAAMDLVVLVVRPSDAVLGDVARHTLAGLPGAVITVAPLGGAPKALALAGVGRLPEVRGGETASEAAA